jgi:hypothetical protein
MFIPKSTTPRNRPVGQPGQEAISTSAPPRTQKAAAEVMRTSIRSMPDPSASRPSTAMPPVCTTAPCWLTSSIRRTSTP